MKRKIRSNVFETNSSSTHSICIAKNVELELPKQLHFEIGEFGWEEDTLRSNESKASYLYTGLLSNDMEENFKSISEYLKEKGIEITFDEPKFSYYGENEENKYLDDGYIDHSNELDDFLKDICEDKEKLMNFLFSDMSFIKTGNDNNESDISICVSYNHDKYYKGN